MKRHYPFILLFAAMMQSCNLFNSSKIADVKLIPFTSSEGKVGYFDLAGKIAINPQFTKAYFFTEGLAAVRNSEGKFGYIDEEGKFVVNPQYKDANPFSEGLAGVVAEGGKCQYINTSGEVKLTLDSTDACGTFCDGLAWFKRNDKTGFIDKAGKEVIQPQFDRVTYFSEGLCPVRVGDDWGYINTEGKLVINPQFKIAYPFREGLAAVSDGKDYGFINKEGKYVINPQFKYLSYFMNGLAAVQQGDQWGYINKEGKFVINPQFKIASKFSNKGLALVYSDSKFGFIDKEGKYVINPQFELATSFIGDLALAGNKDKLGLIDAKGTYKVNPQFAVSLQSYDVNDVFISYKEYVTTSDYFDKEGLINGITEGTSPTEFRHISNTTTCAQLRQLHSSKNEGFYVSGRDVTASPSLKFGNYASCSRINYRFTDIISGQKPVYRTEQRYNPYQGGYENQQVFDHYETVNNEDVPVQSIAYTINLSGKASDKVAEVAKDLATAFNSKLGGTISESSSVFQICNVGSYTSCLTISYYGSTITVSADFTKMDSVDFNTGGD